MNPIDELLKTYSPKSGKTLIVGSKIHGGREDRRLCYKDAIGIDMCEGEGVDLVHDLEKSLPKNMIFDHIECTSVIEHVRRPWKMARNLQNAMSAGATIALSVPFIWRVHAYPNDYWRFTPEAIRTLFDSIQWHKVLFYSNGEFVERPMAFDDDTGQKWLGRTEVVAVGYKCTSIS